MCFFGLINHFDGTIQEDGTIVSELGIIKSKVDKDWAEKKVTIRIRPEDVDLNSHPGGVDNEFRDELISEVFLGDVRVYRVLVSGREFCYKTTGKNPLLKLGSTVYVRFPAEQIVVFPN